MLSASTALPFTSKEFFEVFALYHRAVWPAVDGKSKIDRFRRIILLEGDLSAQQRLRLLEIAEKCPVSQTLQRPSVIESSLAEARTPVAG